MCPLWEREWNLFATQRRAVLFADLKVTFCTNCSVRCTIRRAHVLSTLTSNQFELQRSLIRINILLAEIFRTSSPWNLETFIRTSVFRDAGTWSSESSSLWTLETFIRTSVFRIFSTWSEPHSSEAGTCSSELPVSESSEGLLGKSSELADADYLLIRNTSSEALWMMLCLRVQLLMEWLLPQSQNLF